MVKAPKPAERGPEQRAINPQQLQRRKREQSKEEPLSLLVEPTSESWSEQPAYLLKEGL